MICICMYVCYCIIFIWWNPFIPSRNLDEVIMSLRSHSRVKASMVLTRADHLFIHNYIRSLLNIILKPSLMVRMRLDPCPTTCVYDTLAN